MNISREFLSERPLSFSSLKHFIVSPRHYVRYITAPKKTTEAMLLGSVIHCMILTPDEFDKKYIIEPELDKRTKVGKEDYANFLQKIEGKGLEPISTGLFVTAKEITTQFMYASGYRFVKDSGNREEKFLKRHSSGLDVSGYIDALSDDYVVELKTVQSCAQEDVMRSFHKMMYPLQAAIYHWVTGKRVLYITLETNPPYLSRVFIASDDYLAYGTKIFNKAMLDFNFCLDMGMFDCGYEFYGGDEPLLLDLPGWAKKGGDDEND